MKIIRLIKNNRIIRALFYSHRAKYGYPRNRYGYISRNVIFTPPCNITGPENIYLYGDVSIDNSTISAPNAKFIVKKGCAIAGGLNVRTGNHARIIGKFVGDITEKEKPSGYDKDVIVEEDVWIGSNVTLLAGVTIGRGSTVAAGAVVSKSMPPYCICGGVPAKVIKFYWTIDQIMEHEAKLYPEEERYKRQQLEEIFKKYKRS